MLAPKKTKYRKQQKGVRQLHGRETRGCKLTFGTYGLRAMESGWITARQIEACRIAISREAKRGGRLWIRVFPDKPITKKPAETRMGSGKGSPEYFVAVVRAGRVMFEITGVPKETAKKAFALASAKMPIKTKFVEREENLLSA
jgi:large subunit ribosomal protein L16